MKILIVKGDHHRGAIDEIGSQLSAHGYKKTSGNQFNHGHIHVALAGSYSTAKAYIESNKPELLITDWRIDGLYRHTNAEERYGGAALAAHALKSHECKKVVCADSKHTFFRENMPEAILTCMKLGALQRPEAILPHLPHDPVGSPHGIVQYILNLPNQAHRPTEVRTAPIVTTDPAPAK